ncbi:activating transcription factor 7-interacting protein 1-like [Trachemys scripta elegans]|uniref:activating transcription factor 7-interacting protein 1-like n=1 Tax=Trachemys scripta elegans TaxID=31138 RepID=UPI0015561728|nr:activating transcription factor 7-interacting protein 1-like [Trachemys scripta elegans]
MRVSDRQQLEAVYKVKEELLKTTDVKLLNGKHENVDSDLNSPLSNIDCMEDKKEIANLKHCLQRTLFLNKSRRTIIASVSEGGNQVLDNKKDDLHEEHRIKDSLDQRETESPSEGESKVSCDVNDSSEEKAETNELAVSSDLPVEEEKSAEEEVVDEDTVGEEAISSSMETDQEPKDEGDQSAELPETTIEKSLEEPSENILENTDSMETYEIIPILEKLAPAEDELCCFSKTSLLPVDDTSPDLEDKMENSLGSPSKHE